MVDRRNRFVIFGCCALISLGFGFGCKPKPARIQLPPIAVYSDLPGAFETVLRQANIEARRRSIDPGAVRRLARLYLANRLYTESEICYKAIATMPGGLDAQDRYYRSVIAQNRGDLDTAQDELKHAIALAPGYLPARLALANTLFKSGEVDQAAKEYGAILTRGPSQPEASLGLARIDLQRGREDMAVSSLEQLLAVHPETTSAAALLAQILQRRGQSARSAALTQWSRQRKEPSLPDPWMDELLVDCYDAQRLGLLFEERLNSGQLAQALPLLSRIEELDAKSWIPPFLRGWSELQSKKFDAATEDLRLALSKAGDPEKIYPLLIQALLDSGHSEEVSSVLDTLQKTMPDSIPLLGLAADVALRQGQESRAKTLFVKLLEKDPYLYAPSLNLAKLLWGAGDRDEAVVYLKRILAAYPADITALGLLGQYHLERHDPVSAIIPLETAIAQPAAASSTREQLATMLGLAYLQAGSLKAKENDFNDAISYYDRAILLVPLDSAAYAYKASACVQLKQFPQAIQALEKIHSLLPANPTVLLSLGDVLYQNGDTGQARQRWLEAQGLIGLEDIRLSRALSERLSGHVSTETFN